MARYECSVCGYVYDESGEGGSWSDLGDDWVCPVCGADKSQFQPAAADPPEPGGPVAAQASPARPGEGATAKSGPARPGILVHRVFGYVYLFIYLLLLVQMVPRLWAYQIEFPARSVVHISLGMAIGATLVLKIAIVRFFPKLEQTLVQSLGTSLLVGSVVLIGIAVPSAFREALATRRLFTEENLQRVRTLLAQTGLDEAECTRLASPDSLRAGRRILREECIACHDLRTVLAEPRTPKNWRQTVRRMADRTTPLDPLEEDEQLQVTAYLVALSPQLQASARAMRDEQDRHDRSRQAATAAASPEAQAAAYDPAAAKRLFEQKCSQCHETAVVSKSPPGTADEARKLVDWMVEKGLEATQEELAQIVQYLTEAYVKPSE